VHPTLLAIVLAASPAAGDGGPDPPTTSPRPVYRLDARADGTIMAVSALTIGIPALLASRIIDERCPCDRGGVNGFDRSAIRNHDDTLAVLSTVTVGLAVASPLALDWALLGRGDALTSDALVFAEVLLVNGALTQLVKYSVQRPLPRTYAGDPRFLRDPRGYRSFYSGHTSTAAAALTAAAFTARQRYGEHVWPWLVDAAVASSVALERVAAGRHFPTDVIVGAAAGAAVGVAVPWLHRRSPALFLVPRPGGIDLAGRY
jgi:membrane-associated phospholipid phosphatase